MVSTIKQGTKIAVFSLALIACGCNNDNGEMTGEVNNIKIGIIELIDSSLTEIISPDAQPEIVSEGFEWAEGPVWIESERMLLFSDVPQDTIYKWTEQKRKEVYLTPSGYSGTEKRGGEMGSNGLLLDPEGRLVLCQHGNRQMARMNAPLDNPRPEFITIASDYNGKKFNSPNDAVYNSKGELFFTDPPYGLEKQEKDPKKEIPFQGVYRVKTDGSVQLITDTLTRPNGIAFLPGEKTLIVSNSDPQKPNWYAFDLGADDNFTNGRILLSAMGAPEHAKGLPDGLKVDSRGNVFASGPGGIWIFNSEGDLLGKIKLPDAASNCALSADEKVLFITNDMYLVRVKLR